VSEGRRIKVLKRKRRKKRSEGRDLATTCF
jgi:hypothetical protein